MTKPTLLILAAGMGSRYGGIKQLDQFGPNGETIIDYSLYDAIKAGFGKIVFIIREELKNDFIEIFAPKLEGKIAFDFAIQGFQTYLPADLGHVTRNKPWGTGHAVLCAWQHTDTPFAVINADDFYGYEAFKAMANFLTHNKDATCHAMIAYQLKNTLSENGSVSRGICKVDTAGYLESVTERTKIFKEKNKIVFEEGETKTELAADAPVSMNFWGFKSEIFQTIKVMFDDYARQNINAPKAEFYIPVVMSHLIATGVGKCKVFQSESEWFGITYPEDKPEVMASLKSLETQGKYPSKMW